MHERATYDTGGGHPEIEDLAALLDGKLSAEEAASLRAHLARCEPCLALLAETASFLGGDTEAADVEDVEDEKAVEPEAPPLPFKPRELPRPRRQRSRRWAPAAAAVAALAVATVLFRQQHGPPQVEVARLVASLAG